MKIGRRILENEPFERKIELKEKIDALEKDYHDAGCEVSRRRFLWEIPASNFSGLVLRLYKLHENSTRPCLCQ